MNDNKIQDSHIELHEKEYAQEAESRWGTTDAYKESKKRLAKISKDEMREFLQKQKENELALAKCMKDGLEVNNDQVQELISNHYEGLRFFYEPTRDLYLGLAKMYIEDPRFKKHYEDVEIGLAQYMSEAMKIFSKKI